MKVMCTVLVSMILTASLNSGARADEKAAAEAQLIKLREQITALIGPATCANLVNCRVVGLGLDACGAPLEYVAYSWLSTEKDALETKIAEYNFVQGDLQKAPAAGACATKPEPIAACVNRRCVVRP